MRKRNNDLSAIKIEFVNSNSFTGEMEKGKYVARGSRGGRHTRSMRFRRSEDPVSLVDDTPSGISLIEQTSEKKAENCAPTAEVIDVPSEDVDESNQQLQEKSVDEIMRELAVSAMDGEVYRREGERLCLKLVASAAISDIGYSGMFYFIKITDSVVDFSLHFCGRIALIVIGMRVNQPHMLGLMRSIVEIYGKGGVSKFEYAGPPERAGHARQIYANIIGTLQFRNSTVELKGEYCVGQ